MDINYPTTIPDKLNQLLPVELKVKDINNLTDIERINLQRFIDEWGVYNG